MEYRAATGKGSRYMLKLCEKHHEMQPSRSSRRLVSAIMLAVGLLWAAAGASAHSVTLAWDRNPEPNITGYRLYQGTSSRNYGSGVNVGNQTRFTVNDLVEGRTHYFAVTASNPYGESGYSNELEYTAPRASQGEEPQDREPQDQQPQVQNVLSNAGFENGTSSWTFYTNGNGGFTTVSPGYEGSKAGRVTVTTTGTNTQLYQQGIRLQPYTEYELTFAARSSSGNDLKVSVLKHASPYTNYGLSKRFVDLGTGWKNFKVTFKTRGFSFSVSDARLMFWFSDTAAAGDHFFIDGIVLTKKGSQTVSSTQTAAAAPQGDTTTSGNPGEPVRMGRIVSDDFDSCGLDGGGWSFLNPRAPPMIRGRPIRPSG